MALETKVSFEDDEDLEALRLAALQSLRSRPISNSVPEPPPLPRPTLHNHSRGRGWGRGRKPTFQRHQINSNLITIVPQMESCDLAPCPAPVSQPGMQEIPTKFSRYKDSASESSGDESLKLGEVDEEEVSVAPQEPTETDAHSDSDADSLEKLMEQLEEEIKDSVSAASKVLSRNKCKLSNKRTSNQETKQVTKVNLVKGEPFVQVPALKQVESVTANKVKVQTAAVSETKDIASSAPDMLGRVCSSVADRLDNSSKIVTSSEAKKVTVTNSVTRSLVSCRSRSRTPLRSWSRSLSRSRSRSRLRPRSQTRSRSRSRTHSQARFYPSSRCRSRSLTHSRSGSRSRRVLCSRSSVSRYSPGRSRYSHSPGRSRSPWLSSPRAQISPKNRLSSPRSRPLSPRQRPLSPRPRHASPRLRHLSPRPRKLSPRPRQLSPRPRQLSPRPRQLSPRPRQLSPRPRQLSPRPRQLSPRPRQLSPRPRQLSPRPRQISPWSRQLSPKPRPLSPRQRQSSPRPRQFSPRPRQISPRTRRLSPSPRQLSPRTRRLSPSPRQLSPRTRRLSPSPRQLSPRTRQLSPRPRQLSPRPRQVSPRPRPLSPRTRGLSPASRRSPQLRQRPRQLSPATGQLSPRSRPLSPRSRPLSPRTRPVSPRSRPPSPRRPLSPKPRPRSPRSRPLSPRSRPSSPRLVPSSPRKCPASPRSRPSSPKRLSPRIRQTSTSALRHSPFHLSPRMRRGSISPVHLLNPPRHQYYTHQSTHSPVSRKSRSPSRRRVSPKLHIARSPVHSPSCRWSSPHSTSPHTEARSCSWSPTAADVIRGKRSPSSSPRHNSQSSSAVRWSGTSKKQASSPSCQVSPARSLSFSPSPPSSTSPLRKSSPLKAKRPRGIARRCLGPSRGSRSQGPALDPRSRVEPAEGKVAPYSSNHEDPVFEARRKKFEAHGPVEPAAKIIRLKLSNKVEKSASKDSEKKLPDDGDREKLDLDEMDSYILELENTVNLWSSDERDSDTATEESRFKGPGSKAANQVPAVSSSKCAAKSSVERVSSNSTKSAQQDSKSDSRKENKKNRDLRSKLFIQSRKEAEDVSSQVPSQAASATDLRAELSRRRAQRLTKAGSLHEKLPARLLQSAFKDVVGKKAQKRKDKEGQLKVAQKKESSTKASEKLDGRRVLVLKRPQQVDEESTAISVTIPKAASATGFNSDFSLGQHGKLPIHLRLGVPSAEGSSTRRRSGHKVKVKRSVTLATVARDQV